MRITRRGAALAAAATIPLMGLALLIVPGASATHVEPQLVDDNPSCATVGIGENEFKLQPVESGHHSDPAGPLEVDVTVEGTHFDWSSNIPVLAVIVKGGPDANLYDYRPGETSDQGLHAPINPNNNRPFGLSHVSFCYNPSEPPNGTTSPTPTTDPTTTTPTTDPKKPDFCTGHAFDLRVDTAGILEGFAGPAIKTDPDVFPDKETFSNFEVFFPLGGATEPIATALTLEAENSGDPATGCTTRVKYEDFELDLNNLSDAGGIPVVLTADVIEAIATATLNPDGTAATNTEVTIIGGSLAIGEDAEPQPLAFQPDPDTVIFDQEFGESPNRLQVKVVLHETQGIPTPPNGIAVNAIRILLDLETEIPGVSQSVDVKIAHAEADAHRGS